MNVVRGSLSRIGRGTAYYKPFRIHHPFVFQKNAGAGCREHGLLFADGNRFGGLVQLQNRRFASATPASDGKKATEDAQKAEEGEKKSWIDQISAPHDLIPYKSPIFWILIAILIPVCILNQQFDNRAKLKNDDLKEQRLAQRQKAREEMEKAAGKSDAKTGFVQQDFSDKS